MLREKNEAISRLDKLRVSPRKLNLVAQAIRGKDVSSALKFLRFCPKRIATDVFKVLRSAVSNAEYNHGLDVDALYVKEAFVGKSLTLKRFMPRAKGRGVRIQKRFSNINIVVAEKHNLVTSEVENGSEG
jgi:large subunit ribosomal protein L22